LFFLFLYIFLLPFSCYLFSCCSLAVVVLLVMRLVVAEGLAGERKKEKKVVEKKRSWEKGCFFVEFGPNPLPL
jgi:hypothetical protein